MKSVKVIEITVCEMMANEMMVVNMKQLSPTSSNLEPKCEVRITCEPRVQP